MVVTPLTKVIFVEPRNYILDLTDYDKSKYYLVEMALSGSDIQKLNNNLTGMVELR